MGMRYFELMESGLPAASFLACTDLAPGEVHRRARFRQGSPWKHNRPAGERLSWRGRSFVEAFADINGCKILQAALIDVQSGRAHVALEAWQAGKTADQKFHFICQSSDGAHMRIGDEHVVVTAGDLWRVNDRLFPVVLHAGTQPSLSLAFVMGRDSASSIEAGNENHAPLDAPRTSDVPKRSQYAS